MPLNEKGTGIEKNFEREYGKEQGKRNFYATVKSGKITGKDEDPIRGYMDSVARGDSDGMRRHADAMLMRARR